MSYQLKRTRLIVDFSIRDEPAIGFTTDKGLTAQLVPTRVAVTLTDLQLDAVEVKGPRLREDLTEVPWQTSRVTFRRADSAAMPAWLHQLLADNEWQW